MTDDAAAAALALQLGRWADAGLINHEQARQIIAWEADRGAAPKPSMAGEALAYVGGAVILAALSVIAVGYWDAISTLAKLTIPSIAIVLTVAAGAVVPRRWGDIGVRMRAAIWLVAPAAMLVLMTVIAESTEIEYPLAMLIEAIPVWALATALWLAHRAAAQQLAAFVGLQMVGAALLQWSVDSTGVSVGLVFAGIALAWGALALAQLLPGTGRWAPAAGEKPGFAVVRQRRWALGMAAAGAVFGGVVMGFSGSTAWTGIFPVAVIVAAGVLRGDLMVLIIGAVGTVIVLPAVTDQYLDSTLATAAVLLVVGAVMVALAIIVARRQSRRSRVETQPGLPTGYSR